MHTRGKIAGFQSGFVTVCLIVFGMLLGCGGDAGVNNNNNDGETPGVVISQSDGTTQVTEDGGTDTYTLWLNTVPRAGVLVRVQPDDQLDIGAGPGASMDITFTPLDASTPRTVTIQAVDDSLIEDRHVGRITHTSNSNDEVYDNIPIFDVAADIVDNETSPDFATIQGTITFDNIGLWPDSGEVQVSIWSVGVWTESGPGAAASTAVSAIRRIGNQSAYPYQFIRLMEGPYSAVAVSWIHPDQSLSAEERRAILGVYLNDPNTVSTGLIIEGTPHQGPLPELFLLGAGNNEDGFDIRADFSNIALFFP
ncbi:hypothetical protein MJD09_19255 [bacterium]|nr:hypothetical protein [bacterium]